MKEYANELERLRDIGEQMKRDPYYLEREEAREQERKKIEELYKKYCIDDKTEYIYEFHGEWKKAD